LAALIIGSISHGMKAIFSAMAESEANDAVRSSPHPTNYKTDLLRSYPVYLDPWLRSYGNRNE
jgi:hypothetical protein